MAEISLEKEWSNLQSISQAVRQLNYQIAQLESQIASLESQISSLPPKYDKDGNDVNEAKRNALQSQISMLEGQISGLETQLAANQRQANQLGTLYYQTSSANAAKVSTHSSAASTLQQIQGKRFGAKTAGAVASASTQHAKHYSSLAQEYAKLANAAQQAAQGQLQGGSAGQIADYGGYRGAESNASGTGKKNSGQLGLKNKNNQSRKIGASKTGKGAAVTHASINGNFSGENLTAAADRAWANQTGMTLEEVAAYRQETNTAWQAREDGSGTDLVPSSGRTGYASNSIVSIDGQSYRTDDTGKIHMKRGTDGQYHVLPSTEYTVNGYHYSSDSKGRIKSAGGVLRLDGSKRKSLNAKVSGMKKGDQRGHIIGDLFGGSNQNDNLTAQLGKLNQGEYKSWELELAKLVEAGNEVRVHYDISYKGNSSRPSSYTVRYSINGRNVISRDFKNK